MVRSRWGLAAVLTFVALGASQVDAKDLLDTKTLTSCLFSEQSILGISHWVNMPDMDPKGDVTLVTGTSKNSAGNIVLEVCNFSRERSYCFDVQKSETVPAERGEKNFSMVNVNIPGGAGVVRCSFNDILLQTGALQNVLGGGVICPYFDIRPANPKAFVQTIHAHSVDAKTARSKWINTMADELKKFLSSASRSNPADVKVIKRCAASFAAESSKFHDTACAIAKKFGQPCEGSGNNLNSSSSSSTR